MPLFVEQVRGLLATGETVETEFKTSVPHPRAIAQIIGSMANTSGGQILIGVGESHRGTGIIRGINPARADQAVRRGLDLLDPRPAVEVSTVAVDGKSIAIVAVAPSPVGPVLASGVAYVRDGSHTFPASAARLLDNISAQDPAADRAMVELLALAVEKQGTRITILERDGGWRSKLWWAVIGAVIGALVGIIPTLLIGG